MASLLRQGERYYCQFLHHGKRHCFPIGKVEPDEAEAKVALVAYLLMRLDQGLLQLPVGTDIVTYLRFDGKPLPMVPATKGDLTLAHLQDEYLSVHRRALEVSTITGIAIHFKRLLATLGPEFPLRRLTLADLQRHSTRRAAMKWRRRRISPATIRKELVTLRTAWNWARHMGYVAEAFPPLKRVKFQKLEEKPPFQTWQEIEHQTATARLAGDQVTQLWDGLYLQHHELNELLAYVKQHGTQPWVYPLCAFAAHTGARRSEMVRAQVRDIDFASDTILIRERKRTPGNRTYRRAPLTAFLRKVLLDWIEIHPGGSHLFCHGVHVGRSKKRSRDTGYIAGKARPSTHQARLARVHQRAQRPLEPLTRNEVHDHFKRTLQSGKWEVLKGLHALRNSFISLAASKNVDQRLIDEWVGHQTEQQRRRYRHLFPSVQQKAISSMFEGE